MTKSDEEKPATDDPKAEAEEDAEEPAAEEATDDAEPEAEDDETPEEASESDDSKDESGSDSGDEEESDEAGDEAASTGDPSKTKASSSKTRKRSGKKKNGKKKSPGSGKKSKKTSEGNESGQASADSGKSGGSSKKKKKKSAEKKEGAPQGDQYLCVHCDHSFFPESEGEPKRCPSCMRKGGLELVRKAKEGGRPAWLVPAAVVGLIALVGIGYAVWDGQTADPVEGDAPIRPLSTSELLGYLQVSNAGRAPAEIFDGGDAIDALAEEASGEGPVAKAEALVAHLAERRDAAAFEPWSFSTPRDTEIRGAERTAARLGEEEAAHLYPLEVALATTVALREAGVDAMVAELWSFPEALAPPDPSGHFGYFGVAVYEGEVGEGEPTLFDPYGGREEMPGEDGYRVLSDPQVAGAFLSTEALYARVHEGDLTDAMAKVRKALRLDPRAPYARSVQAAIFLASGGVQEGVDELNAAVQIRADPPRRNLLAGVFLATGDADGAQREVSLALEEAPEFADAHATLAALHMMDADLDAAAVALEAAERFDPGLVNLKMLWAQYYLQTGNPERAVGNALEAIERRPHDWQERLRAAQVFRAADEWNEMRRQAHAILELAPSGQEEAIRRQVLEVLGDTAFEEFDEELALDPEDYAGGEELALDDDLGGLDEMAEPDLSLDSGSSLLGDGPDEGSSGPSLLDQQLGGGGGFQLGSPGGGLQLRPPGQKLNLQLGN
jgi:tetratricopeptide (TPR) repeat protein